MRGFGLRSIFDQRKKTVDGALAVSTATPPAGGDQENGWAIDPSGNSYVQSAGAAVPADAVKMRGLALTPSGALYITDSAVAASSIWREGFAFRSDGALHITSQSAAGVSMAGMLISSGRLYMSGLGLTNCAATISGTDITITATSGSDLTDGTFGVEYGIGRAVGYLFSSDVSGEVTSQSITIGAAQGIVANDVVNIRVFYQTEPFSTKYYGTDITPALGARGVPTGTQSSGNTLTVANSTEVAAAGASAMTISYQWIRGASTEIPGATSSTYVLQGADVGSTIKVRVTETTNTTPSLTNSVTSSATGVIT